MKKTKVAIFGTGVFYQNRKEKLNMIDSIQICVFLDNNVKLWGMLLDGIQICSPQNLNSIQYEYIVLMSTYATEMHKQLIQIGVEEDRILYWDEFIAQFSKEWKIYRSDNVKRMKMQEKILIVTTDISYNGGSMAAIYAAIGLQSRNYKVNIAAPYGDNKLIHEINNYGIDVILYNVLPYISKEGWIEEYQVIIVNVLQMMQCACEISKYRPVLWWIHEPNLLYDAVISEFSRYAHEDNMQNINLYAVSNIAKQNFNLHFSKKIKKILHYGIPDMRDMNERTVKNKKTIFAIIGSINELKAQDIFLQAANQIEATERVEFWIIGALYKDAYGCRIMEIADSNPNVKIKGVLTREEIYNIFPQIDVVVCASREETMSLAVNEGMMFGKVCITTDNTGIADYIRDGENGFIVPVGDIEALRKRMQWIIDNRNQINRIGNKARETYEKYFSMEIFGEHLEKAVKETIEGWKQRG